MTKEHDIFSGLGRDAGKSMPASVEQPAPAEKESVEEAETVEAGVEVSEEGKVNSSDVIEIDKEGVCDERCDHTVDVEIPCEDATNPSLHHQHTVEIAQSLPIKDEEDRVNDLAAELERAECIGESFDNFKVVYTGCTF